MATAAAAATASDVTKSAPALLTVVHGLMQSANGVHAELKWECKFHSWCRAPAERWICDKCCDASRGLYTHPTLGVSLAYPPPSHGPVVENTGLLSCGDLDYLLRNELQWMSGHLALEVHLRAIHPETGQVVYDYTIIPTLDRHGHKVVYATAPPQHRRYV